MNQLERLEIRIGVMGDRINALRSGGLVAPPYTWIQKYYVKKSNGKKYYYYRLMEATNRRSRTGKIQGKVRLYLGNRHSSKYKSYKSAIARRKELKFLQSRCDLLMKMYQKAVSDLVGTGNNSDRCPLSSDQLNKDRKIGGLNNIKLVGNKQDRSLEDPLFFTSSSLNDPIKSNIADLVPAISDMLPTVEKLEASNEQLWYWMRAIALLLGINIPAPRLEADSC